MKKIDTVNENSQSIVFRLPVTASGSGEQTRNGEPVEQSMEKPTTAKILPGAILYHRIEAQAYEVVSVQGTAIHIRRCNDQSEFACSLSDIKHTTWLVTYKSGGQRAG